MTDLHWNVMVIVMYFQYPITCIWTKSIHYKSSWWREYIIVHYNLSHLHLIVKVADECTENPIMILSVFIMKGVYTSSMWLWDLVSYVSEKWQIWKSTNLHLHVQNHPKGRTLQSLDGFVSFTEEFNIILPGRNENVQI